MFGFIALFFPAVLSVALVEHFSKRKLSIRGLIYCYVAANLFTNIVCILIKMGLFQVAVTTQGLSANMAMQVAVDYLMFAIPAAILFSFIATLLGKSKNILVMKSDDEESEKN